MKFFVLGIAVGVIAASVSCNYPPNNNLVVAQSSDRNRSSERYSPTKLEWLAVEANSVAGNPYFTGHEPSIVFYPDHQNDRLVLRSAYAPTADRQHVNELINSAKETASTLIESRKWDWIEIEENVEMLDKKTRRDPLDPVLLER